MSDDVDNGDKIQMIKYRVPSSKVSQKPRHGPEEEEEEEEAWRVRCMYANMYVHMYST